MEKETMIEDFRSMVNAVVRATKPWRITTWLLVGALLLSNICWAVAFVIMN